VANLHSTTDKAESDRVLARLEGLSSAGTLYRSTSQVDGKTRYRIRLGFFGTSAEASQAGKNLSSAAGLSAEPWVDRPTESELSSQPEAIVGKPGSPSDPGSVPSPGEEEGKSSPHYAVTISSLPPQSVEAIWSSLNSESAKSYLSGLSSAQGGPPALYRYEIKDSRGQPTVRLRLGFFQTQAEAREAAEGLIKAASLDTAKTGGQPWVARPSLREELTYGKKP
jgi:hypothetical protein